MLRGTKFIDHNWYLSGTNDRKIYHLLDFIDISIFLKSKITNSLGIYSETSSGGLTALCAMLREPFLFDAISVCNPITNLPNYCFQICLITVFKTMTLV